MFDNEQQPLTSPHMTRASRVTLWVYPVFCIIIGTNYMVANPNTLILTSASLHALDGVVPLKIWGLLFEGIGVWLMFHRVYGLRKNARFRYSLGLVTMAGLLGMWSIICIGAALFSDGSWSAFAFPATIGVLAVASIITIDAEEAPGDRAQ